jgi:pimeloyl-ACP methyl ester carboxylesterase
VQPIVIVGGFMSFAMLYDGMRDALEALTGQPVFIVETHSYDWLPSVSTWGWVYLLGKVERAVRQAVRESDTGKVTLIGHSAGGVLARLYLSPQLLWGHAYRGLDDVDSLITLGSPHVNRGGLARGGRMSRWVERHYPGACFEGVAYISVAGKLMQGKRAGTPRERFAYGTYKQIGGKGDDWGDGMIPVKSALLSGACQIVLEGVGHFTGFGGPWYGSREVIPLWWQKVGGNHVRTSKSNSDGGGDAASRGK